MISRNAGSKKAVVIVPLKSATFGPSPARITLMLAQEGARYVLTRTSEEYPRGELLSAHRVLSDALTAFADEFTQLAKLGGIHD